MIPPDNSNSITPDRRHPANGKLLPFGLVFGPQLTAEVKDHPPVLLGNYLPLVFTVVFKKLFCAFCWKQGSSILFAPGQAMAIEPKIIVYPVCMFKPA